MVANVTELLAPHLRADSDAPAQRFPTEQGWMRRSYGELSALVDGVAGVLLSAGAAAGARVALIAPTRADWTVVDLACARLGAPLVPIYPTAAPAQIADIVRRSSPAILIAPTGMPLPPLDPAVRILRLGDADGDLGDLDPAGAGQAGAGQAGADSAPAAALRALPPAPAATDLFTIAFSSGSTGEPKGCLLTHANWVAVLEMCLAAETHPERGLAHRAAAFVYLPLAHASARLQQLTTLAAGGELIYGTGDTADILRQIAEVRPTYVPGVPRLFESAHARVGGDPAALRAIFGDRLLYALSGGAPIDAGMLDAYRAAGIELVNGYGLTETSTALAIGTPHDSRPGTVGRPLPGVEIRIAGGGDIAADGEILARGANVFSGYLDAPAATAAAFVDGWFRTGDLGRLDAAGHLVVTGRTKNLLVTSTGKNVAPEPAENLVRSRCAVDDVLVVGDRRPYLIAIATDPDGMLDPDALVAALREHNELVSPPERIRRAVVVPDRLAVDAGERTASGKVVRSAALDRFAALIDAVYADRAEGVLEIVARPPRLRATA
ncbi:AMP-binding protein [Schumannella sp. 10F1B-5-1]|uniref:AMP-binding protein n=1 Tax=Schumannella sp. 10F1B-5-1 TaxID=2590780 RepID=UPI001130BE68|nr:AMP-binding protein [Schumannella sp. 10F1B-5-1]TPW78277.1 long-chain fatty acid--CoA ligase [Schumannella sp. 10F1B-5-1]